MKTLKIKATLMEEMLGSQPGDPEIHENFISSKAPDAPTRKEEIEAIGVGEAIEKAMTYFYRRDAKPCLMDYQVKGFFKSAASAVNSETSAPVKKLTAHKKKIDTLVFVYGTDGSRFIPIHMPKGGRIGSKQRPLRGQTAQGERIALANSETVPAGSVLEFDIVILDDSLEAYVRAWLDYGKFNGLGQWRNAGHGRFSWELREEC